MRFIVAVDGSEESDDALRYAIEIARQTDADVDVVHSIMPDIYSEGGEVLIEDMSDAEARARGILDEALETVEAEGFETNRVTTHELYGDPVEEIVSHSEEVGADGIFVGHRGVSEKHEDVVGSVAQELVRKASVPVTVVR